MNRHKSLSIVMGILFAFGVLSSYFLMGEKGRPILFETVMENNLIETGVTNIVMNVYLNYRVFDTLFEAMLLLICVMGVMQFSNLSAKEYKFYDERRLSDSKEGFSTLMIDGLKGVYPFIFIFGVYVILSGINSPGGGFQGGAIIAAIIMSLHLSTGRTIVTMSNAVVIEKIMFILLLIIVIVFIALGERIYNNSLYIAYMVFINITIGIKVFMGFVILYLEFMNSRSKHPRDMKEGK